MDKENILTFINNDLIIKGTIYSHKNVPNQIGNAIYTFGSNDILDIIAFIDSSDSLDGSLGMIITSDSVYFKFNESGCFKFDEITNLELEKHHLDNEPIAFVTTNNHKHSFNKTYLDPEKFIKLLATITNLEVEMILTDHEKVAHYIPIILNDLLNNEYEDVFLTKPQQIKIKEFYQELDLIDKLDQENYQFELERLCNQALSFFDELELDSDEIDILLELQNAFTNQNNQSFEGAQKYYDEMVNKYKNGDPSLFDQMKNVMNSLGINEKDLDGKSPDELNKYIDDLCSRFGISRSQMEALSKKFKS